MKTLNRLKHFHTIKKQPPTRILMAGIGVLSVLIVIVGVYKITVKNNEFKTVHDPEKAIEVGKSLREIVSKIYAVPDEDPTIATVTDTSVLPEDPFYKKAINGDKILIFSASRKAIMYRPSENRVIDVADVAPAVAEPAPKQEVAGTYISSESAETIVTSPKVLIEEKPSVPPVSETLPNP